MGGTDEGFTLPQNTANPLPPLGLAGHIHDQTAGLTYMHHRYYHPRLGHFLTPDFRAPDIYDPTTFTEPYAYAQGNPIMFWDPNGLSNWFFDGTWNDKDNPDFGPITNVAKLWELSPPDQRFYVKGVGTGPLPGGDGALWWDKIKGGYTGSGSKDRLEYMWGKFEEYYRSQILRWLNGDKNADLNIGIFGFSRGSALALTFAGKIEATVHDKLFYTHELREYVRYRRLGWRRGQPNDGDLAYDLWNNAHTATLEDYQIRGLPEDLYHPSARKYLFQE